MKRFFYDVRNILFKLPKKITAMILAVLMITGTFSAGISGIMSPKAEAASVSPGDVAIAVPETIYLKPESGNMSEFQYFLNNTISGEKYDYISSDSKSTYDSKGYVEFKSSDYPNQNITLSANIKTTSSATTDFSSTKQADGNGDVKFEIDKYYLKTAIAANTTSTITWTLKDKDGNEIAKAYTVAYAPYLESSAASAQGLADKNDKLRRVGVTSAIFGIHSLTSNASTSRTVYVGSKQYSVNTSNVTQTAGIFKPKNSSGTQTYPILNPDYPVETWTGSNNTGAFASGTGGYLCGYRKSTYRDVTSIGGIGQIYVDNSRFTNFGDIPNFTARGDYNGGSNEDTETTYATTCGIIEGQYNTSNTLTNSVQILSTGSGLNAVLGKANLNSAKIFTDDQKSRGIDTVYVVVLSIGGIRVESCDSFSDWQYGNALAVCEVKRVDKSAIRALVSTDIGSKACYAYGWDNYQTKLENACKALGNPKSTATDVASNSTAYTELVEAIKLLRRYKIRLDEDKDEINSNLLAFNNQSGTVENVTYSVNATTGMITFNGTAKKWDTDLFDVEIGPLDAGNYILSSPVVSGTYGANCAVCVDVFNDTSSGSTEIKADGNQTFGVYSSGSSKSYTIPSNANIRLHFRVYGNDSGSNYLLSNLQVKLKLEKKAASGEPTGYTQSGVCATKGKTVPSVSVPSAPTGYSFEGFYTGKGGTGTQYYDKTGAGKIAWSSTDEVITLYAYWKPITYTVTYNGNGNTGGSTTASTHTYDKSEPLTANGFTRVYTVTYDYMDATEKGAANAAATYNFDGWAKSASGTKEYADKASVTNLASTQGASVTLYAKWKDGGITLPTPKRTGYTFGGWYTERYGAGTKVGDGGGTYYPTSNITIYAKWTKNNYTLTVDPNGGTYKGSENPTNENIPYYDKVNLENPVRPGYMFAGWDRTFEIVNGRTEDTNDPVLDLNKKYPASGYTTNFSGGSGITATEGQEATGEKYTHYKMVQSSASSADTYRHIYFNTNYNIAAGDTVNIKMFIRKTASSQTNWNLYNGNKDNDYDHKVEILSAGAGNLNEWKEINFSRTFTSSDALGNVGYVELCSGNIKGMSGTISEFDIKEVTTTITHADGTTTVLPSEFYMPARHVTLTAKWREFYYTIKFNANSGSGSMSDKSLKFAENWNLTANAFTKKGYYFNGWNPNADGSGQTTYTDKQQVSGLSTVDKGVVNLYAIWAKNPYTVKFLGNGATGGTGVQSESGAYYYTQPFSYDTAQNLYNNKFERKYTVTYSYDNATGGKDKANDTATYTFTGWKTASGAANEDGKSAYSQGESVNNLTSTKNATVSLNAQWNTGSVTLPSPTRTGYTFDGWYDAASGGNRVGGAGDSYTPSAGITLHAHWTPIRYNVEFDGNGATGGSKSKIENVAYDSSVNLINDSSTGFKRVYTVKYNYNGADGNNGQLTSESEYEFNGWNTADDGKGTPYEATNAVHNVRSTAGTTKLYAQWTPVSVTPLIPTKTGYTFKGWYTDSEFKNAAVLDDSGKYTPTASVILYAKWEANVYNIAFNANGGSGSIDSIQKTCYTDKDLPLNNNRITRTGYIFSGWNTEADGSGTPFADGAAVKDDLSYTNGATVTLYAQWKAITYTVNYKGNGSTSGSTADSTHTYDKSEPLTANGFKREYTVKFNGNGADGGDSLADKTAKYTFTGWAETNTGAKKYEDKASVKNLASTQGATVPLYAKWTSASASVTLPTPTKTGYTFGGWYTSSTFTDGTKVEGSVTPSSADVTLHAKWLVNSYTIIFNANTGSGTMTSMPKTCYTDAPLPANTFTKTGYEFVGWNTNANGSGDAFADGATVTKDLTYTNGATVTLYAQWKAITYTVNYHGNGATGGNDSYSLHTYDTERALADNSFEKKHTVKYEYNGADTNNGQKSEMAEYTFAGWAKSADGAKEYEDKAIVKNLASTKGAEVNLYAVWKDGGITPPVPGKTGYVFGGWYTSSTFDESTKVEGLYKPSADVTLYARWIAEVRDITYDEQFDIAKFSSALTNGTASAASVSGDTVTVTTTAAGQMTNADSYKIPVEELQEYIFSYSQYSPDSAGDNNNLQGWITFWDENGNPVQMNSAGSKVYTENELKHFYPNNEADLSSAQKADITFICYYANGDWYQWTPTEWAASRFDGKDSICSGLYNTDAGTHSGTGVYGGTRVYFFAPKGAKYVSVNFGAAAAMTANFKDISLKRVEHYTLPDQITGESYKSTDNLAFNPQTDGFYHPDYDGFTFDKWTIGSGTTQFTNSTDLTQYKSGISLKSNWHENKYRIEFIGNGSNGGSTAAKENVLYRENVTLTNGFTRAYTVTYKNNNGKADTTDTASYTFSNWTDSAGKTYQNNANVSKLAAKDKDNDEIKLTAQWTSASVTLPTPVRPGYKFMGWYSDSEFKTFIGDGGTAYTPTGSIALYAKWELIPLDAYYYDDVFSLVAFKDELKASENPVFTVDTENGTVKADYTVDDSEIHYTDSPYKVALKPSTEYKFSYKFAAGDDKTWSDIHIHFYDADGNSLDNQFAKDGTLSNIYAIDEESKNIASYVSFYNNKEVISRCDGVYTSLANSDVAGANGKTYLKFTTPAECAYAIVNFGIDSSNEADGKASVIFSDISLCETSPLTKKVYNVKSTVNGVGMLAAAPERIGYSHDGWIIANDNSVLSAGTDLSKYYEGMTLISKWKPNTYTVEYNGNGANSGSTPASSHIYDVTKSLSENGFTKGFTISYNYYGGTAEAGSGSGSYRFDGWARTADGEVEFSKDNGTYNVKNLSADGKSNVTLYAKWTEASVTLPTSTKAGYIFAGWYSDSSFTSYVGFGGDSYTATGAVTLHAKWVPAPLDVTYDELFDITEFGKAAAKDGAAGTNTDISVSGNEIVVKSKAKSTISDVDYRIPVEAGKEYLFTVYQKCSENGKYMTPYITFFDADDNPVNFKKGDGYCFTEEDFDRYINIVNGKKLNNIYENDGNNWYNNTLFLNEGGNKVLFPVIWHYYNSGNKFYHFYEYSAAKDINYLKGNSAISAGNNTTSIGFGNLDDLYITADREYGDISARLIVPEGAVYAKINFGAVDAESENEITTYFKDISFARVNPYSLPEQVAGGAFTGAAYRCADGYDITPPARDGFTFNYWKNTATGAEFDPSTLNDYPNGVTLESVWTEHTYTVHFDGNGNTNTGASIADITGKKYTETFNLPYNTLPDDKFVFEKTGWYFAGWSANPNAKADDEGVYSERELVSKLAAKVNNPDEITLYAVWSRIRYTINYYREPGVLEYTQEREYGDEKLLENNFFSSQKVHFIYGDEGPDVEEKYKCTGEHPESKDVSYRIKGWARTHNGEVAYAGDFKGDLTDADGKLLKHNSTIDLYPSWDTGIEFVLPNPEREGLDLVGWYTIGDWDEIQKDQQYQELLYLWNLIAETGKYPAFVKDTMPADWDTTNPAIPEDFILEEEIDVQSQYYVGKGGERVTIDNPGTLYAVWMDTTSPDITLKGITNNCAAQQTVTVTFGDAGKLGRYYFGNDIAASPDKYITFEDGIINKTLELTVSDGGIYYLYLYDKSDNFNYTTYTFYKTEFDGERTANENTATVVTYSGNSITFSDAIKNISRAGYNYNGWFENETYSGTAYRDSYTPVKNTVLHAGWTPNVVLFNENKTVDDSRVIENLIAPTWKSGFEGLTVTRDASETIKVSGTQTSDVTLFTSPFDPDAETNYRVTVELCSGTVAGDGYLVVEFTTTSGEVLGEDIKYIYDYSTGANGSAVFKFNSEQAGKTGGIKVWLCNGSGNTFSDYQFRVKLEKASAGDAYAYSKNAAHIVAPASVYASLPTPERTGYTFDGWSTIIDGEAISDTFNFGAVVGTQTFYAKWKANTYTIVYQGGSANYIKFEAGNEPKQTCTYDTDFYLLAEEAVKDYYERKFNVSFDPDCENATIEGGKGPIEVKSTFAGWLNTDTEEIYTDLESLRKNLTSVNNGTIELVAQWKDTEITLPTAERPIGDNGEKYNLQGWFDSSRDDAKRLGGAGTKYTVSSNITFYAKWTPVDIKDKNIAYDFAEKTTFSVIDVNGYDIIPANLKEAKVIIGSGLKNSELIHMPTANSNINEGFSGSYSVQFLDSGSTNLTFSIPDGEDDENYTNFKNALTQQSTALFLSGSDSFTGTASFYFEFAFIEEGETESKWQYITGQVNIIPANSVYYEETVFDVNDTINGPEENYGTEWAAEGIKNLDSNAGVIEYQAYGYSREYRGSMTYSAGTAIKADVSELRPSSKMSEFKFNGAGFELVSDCGPNTSALMVYVWKYVGRDYRLIANSVVDTRITDENLTSDGLLKQVPVYHFLSTERAQYLVQVCAIYVETELNEDVVQGTKSFDELTDELEEIGVKVDEKLLEVKAVNKAETEEAQAEEIIFNRYAPIDVLKAVTAEQRLLGIGEDTSTGYIDGIRVYKPTEDESSYYSWEKDATFFNILQRTRDEAGALTEYQVDGQNDMIDEIYLAPKDGEDISSTAFSIDGFESGKNRIMVSLRAANGETEVYVSGGEGSTGKIVITLDHSTEMYYDITDAVVNGTVVISNNGDGYAAVCNLKVTADSGTINVTPLAPQKIEGIRAMLSSVASLSNIAYTPLVEPKPQKEEQGEQGEQGENPPSGDTAAVKIFKFEKSTNSVEVEYRSTVKFYAVEETIPDGAKLCWYLNGKRDYASDGKEALVLTELKEQTTVQAKILGEDDSELAESGKVTVKVKSGFFQKLIAFIRGLFRKLPVYDFKPNK